MTQGPTRTLLFAVGAVLFALTACSNADSSRQSGDSWIRPPVVESVVEPELELPTQLAFASVNDCEPRAASEVDELARVLGGLGHPDLAHQLREAAAPIEAGQANPQQLAALAGVLEAVQTQVSGDSPDCFQTLGGMTNRLAELGFADDGRSGSSFSRQVAESYGLDGDVADCASASIDSEANELAAGGETAELALLQTVSRCLHSEG